MKLAKSGKYAKTKVVNENISERFTTFPNVYALSVNNENIITVQINLTDSESNAVDSNYCRQKNSINNDLIRIKMVKRNFS